MPTNAKQFNAALQEFVKNKVPEELVKLVRLLSLDLLRRVVLKTPVDEGRARGNWQLAIESTTEAEVSTIRNNGEANSSGAASDAAGAVNEALGALGSLQPFQTVFVFNNVPYILRLEHGWSKQAPSGMVALSLQELLQVFP